jgi:hypothetical protein
MFDRLINNPISRVLTRVTIGIVTNSELTLIMVIVLLLILLKIQTDFLPKQKYLL